MNRIIVIVLLFLSFQLHAADPIQATQVSGYKWGTFNFSTGAWVYSPVTNSPDLTPAIIEFLCPVASSHASEGWDGIHNGTRCGFKNSGGSNTLEMSQDIGWSCPDGYTLNGNMCYPNASCPMYGTPEGNNSSAEKPAGCSCPAGTQWVPTAGCRAKCNTSYQTGEVVAAGWPFEFAKGQSETCFQGCVVQKSGVEFVFDDGTAHSPASQTGWACQTSSEPATPPAKEAPDKPKEPPCPATHGVLTSSSGTVACVPYGTPSPRKPDVQVKEKKETFPDQTTKTTTTTTTTDPKTSATHTSSTTTSTGGMSGSPGSTTSSETTSGKDGSGDGDGECTGTDCGDGDYQPGEMPSTEGLYEKKFPDGVSGVLDTRYQEMKNTPLFDLVATLVPSNLPNSGSCTPFTFSMNIGPKMMLGAGSLQVPCYVWDFIRLCMYISALLLARRLVFGG